MAVYGPVHILPYNPHAMNYLLYNLIFKDHQCLSPLTLWIGASHRRGALDTIICDKVCQLLAAYRWISPDTPVYSTNKTDPHDITEMLLKVVLSTITPSTVFDKIKRNVVVDKWHLLHFELISEDFPCPNEYFKCTDGHVCKWTTLNQLLSRLINRFRGLVRLQYGEFNIICGLSIFDGFRGYHQTTLWI
jgi:hypothetical protein